MAGHSKWANIKHRKGAADAKRGKVFSKIARDITLTARSGGGDPDANITLRALVSKARGVNMPADNIERAIKKGTGELKEDVVFEELTYEGYAPGGFAIVVEVVTDNKNRSASEVRLCFTKAGANFSTQGSVTRSFQRKGIITILAEGQDEDTIMEIALENGADDVITDEERFTVYTTQGDFQAVVSAFTTAEIPLESSEVELIPDAYSPVDKTEKARKLLKFVDSLEDLDDVQDVWHNFEFSDTVLAELEAE